MFVYLLLITCGGGDEALWETRSLSSTKIICKCVPPATSSEARKAKARLLLPGFIDHLCSPGSFLGRPGRRSGTTLLFICVFLSQMLLYFPLFFLYGEMHLPSWSHHRDPPSPSPAPLPPPHPPSRMLRQIDTWTGVGGRRDRWSRKLSQLFFHLLLFFSFFTEAKKKKQTLSSPDAALCLLMSRGC